MDDITVKTKALLADWLTADPRGAAPDVYTTYRDVCCWVGCDGYIGIGGIGRFDIRTKDIMEAKMACIVAVDLWLNNRIILTRGNYHEFCGL